MHSAEVTGRLRTRLHVQQAAERVVLCQLPRVHGAIAALIKISTLSKFGLFGAEDIQFRNPFHLTKSG